MEYLTPPIFTGTPEQRLEQMERFLFDLSNKFNYTVSVLEKLISEKGDDK